MKPFLFSFALSLLLFYSAVAQHTIIWVVVENKEKSFTIYFENNNVFFQMLKPEKPKGADNDYTSPPFPAGNLGIMCAIPPIGTKFQAPEKMGPQSQKNTQLNDTPYSGVLWFEF